MIKNYTSTVPAERTISRIEADLVCAGAQGIMKDYQGGKLVAITFSVPKPGGGLAAIRLPADVKAVYQVLMKAKKRLQWDSEERTMHQAERTAWRLMQDWVEVQLSLIEMKQAEFFQVFLPYVWDGKQTFYEKLRGSNFKLLKGPEE